MSVFNKISLPFTPNTIEEKILENYIEYQNLFSNFQSNFLSDLYKRYQGMETANLALYFARQSHENILRQKDYDFNFNLSFKKFWQNHSKIEPKKHSIIKIASEVSLPKETTRRKILQLVKQKVIGKKNGNFGWLPNEQYKESYNSVIINEIENLSELIQFTFTKTDISISKQELQNELQEKFSFYWFHYLNAQLEYFKIWGNQLKDLDLILITLQITTILASRAKEKKLSYESIYNNPSMIKDFNDSSISATSISEVTNIPRATCIRKLKTLILLKMISQDKNSKRYYLSPANISKNLISKQITKNIVKVFSNFFFICLKTISFKTSN